MDIGSVGNIGNVPSFAGVTNTPALQLLQANAQADAALFSGVSGEPSDLASFTPTAAAFSLFKNPALLRQLQQWDGTPTPGSERTATPATQASSNSDTPTTSAQPSSPVSFNPFDQASWWTPSTGTNLDLSA